MKKFLRLSLLLLAASPWAAATQTDQLFFPADNSADRLDAYEQQAYKEELSVKKRRFKQLRAEVRNGYADSLTELALAYYHGFGVKKNYKKAYKYMQKAAQNGDAVAAVMQAQMSASGKGTSQNIPAACAMLLELAQNANPHAAFQLYKLSARGHCGLTAQETQQQLDFAADKGVSPAWFEKSLQSQSPEEAFKNMERAARLEYRPAQYTLARMYEDGRGTQAIPAKAFDYMRLAAKQKLPQAQWQIAQWYEQGYGTEKSPFLAFHWTRIAAKNNIKDAQKRLADMYRSGYGTPVNLGAARNWEKKAASPETAEEPLEEFY